MTMRSTNAPMPNRPPVKIYKTPMPIFDIVVYINRLGLLGRLQWLYLPAARGTNHAVDTDDRAAVFTEFRVFGARAAVWAKKLTVRNICTAIFADHKKISFAYLNICPPKS